MVDKVVDAVRSYWSVIATVAGLMAMAGVGIYSIINTMNNISGDLRELRAVVHDNLNRLNQEAERGQKYTINDHIKDAKEQAERDREQDKEISDLRQQLNRK